MRKPVVYSYRVGPAEPSAVPGAEGSPVVPGYQMQDLLGAGAQGQVWRAVQEGSRQEVAVKLVERAESSAARQELAVLGRVRHPHLIRLREWRRAADGRLALVTDLVRGPTLQALVEARGTLTPGEVVTLLTPLAQALEHVHGRSVVHGDISAGNVMFDADGRPLLIDLGVASLLGWQQAQHATGGFADPSTTVQGRHEPAGDVYSLAALAWFALTGQVPQGPGLRPPLLTLAPEVPLELAELLDAALSADPADRPAPGEVALRAYQARPAEPIRLVDAQAAPERALTQRLRRRAGGAEESGDAREPEPLPGRRRLPGLRLLRSRRPGASGVAEAGGPGGDGPRSRDGGAAGRASGRAASARRDGARTAPGNAAGDGAGLRARGSGARRRRGVTRRADAFDTGGSGARGSNGLGAGGFRPGGFRTGGFGAGLRRTGGRRRTWVILSLCGFLLGGLLAFWPGIDAFTSSGAGQRPASAEPGDTAASGEAEDGQEGEGRPEVESVLHAALAGEDPVAAVQAASELRAMAFETATQAPLDLVDAPGSPALSADLQVLAQLQEQQARLDGLSFEISDATLLSVSATAADVQVTVATSEHRVLGSEDGQLRAEVPATAPATLVLALERADGQWRISEVSAA